MNDAGIPLIPSVRAEETANIIQNTRLSELEPLKAPLTPAAKRNPFVIHFR